MCPATSSAPHATPDRPWLGLAHFTAADREYFYGREAEIRELTERVRRAPLTVLYGVSGYGKSSVIGAGLIPRLGADGHVVTLLHRCYDDLALRPLVGDVLAAVMADHPAAVLPDAPSPSLWEFFHERRQPWFARAEETGSVPPRPVLILDQFEEIFTRGEDRNSADKAADASARAHAREFLNQLADLVENRPPASLRERLDSGTTADKRDLIRRYDFQARPPGVLVSLRDDFLARLERWRRVMPGMMEHRVELRLLAGPQAYLAVFHPGNKRPGKPPLIPPEVATAIVRAAAGVADDVPLEEIDAVPPILSLLCERLNARRLAAPGPPGQITAADFSGTKASQILGTFYDEKLGHHPAAMRDFIENKLVSDAGFRENISVESAVATLRSRVPDAPERLRQLVDDRILVIETRGGLPRVELTHDTLARHALESRAGRQARARRMKVLGWFGSCLAVAGLFAARHELAASCALLLALGIGRFVPVWKVMQYRWVPLALFGLLLLAVPLTIWTGRDLVIHDAPWWRHWPGWIAAMLALVCAMSYALPRFNRAERGGLPALAGVMFMTPVVALGLLGAFTPFFLLFAIAGLTILAGGHGWRRWAALAATFALFAATMVAVGKMYPRATDRFLGGHSAAASSQEQSLLSVNAGGLTGSIHSQPELADGNTAFVFGRQCATGGILSGMLVLLLSGLLLTHLWRITARRRQPGSRVLAAGCAAVLTAQVFFHVFVNVGLWPAMAVHFPFLSYGPQFLLADAVLLGVLLALDREETSDELVPARWPTTSIVIGGWMLLVPVAVRLHELVFDSPHLVQIRQWQDERLAERNRAKSQAPRGRIVDAAGRVLAQTIDGYHVCADPKRVRKSPDRKLLPQLASLVGMEPDAFVGPLANRQMQFVRLVKHIPASTAEAIRRINISGVSIETVPARDYPGPPPLAHLVGIARARDEMPGKPVVMTGRCGAEWKQNDALAGGHDVRLTLDVTLQADLQQIAEDAVSLTHAQQAQIVVINPRSGALHAAAQVPATHGGVRDNIKLTALLWHADTDYLEPGGLIKPLVMASAMEAGVLGPDTVIDCENGLWTYQGHPLRDEFPSGLLGPEEILIHSNNIGMAKIGVLMGKQPLYDSLVGWGLTTKCTAGFNASSGGLLRAPDRWSQLEITRIPMGYGCSCTLLQMLRAYTTFFNEGNRVEPHWTVPTKPQAPTKVLKPETARWIRAAMTKAVATGNARDARIDNLSIAGKTSVVQKTNPRGGYSEGTFQTAFIGGFEAGGSPCLIAVWLDEPDRDGGGNPAVEVFRKAAIRITHQQR